MAELPPGPWKRNPYYTACSVVIDANGEVVAAVYQCSALPAVLALPELVAAVEAGRVFDAAVTNYLRASGEEGTEAAYKAMLAAREDLIQKNRAALAKAAGPGGGA